MAHDITLQYVHWFARVPVLGTCLLCLLFYLLCYAAVLIKFTYYAQNYAQEYNCA